MAFPTTGVLDAFIRANETPIGAPWAGPLYSGETQLNLTSEALACDTTGANSYYNLPFGADCECWADVNVKPGAGDHINLFARIANPNTASLDGYRVSLLPQAGTDIFRIQRVDNAATFTLGADISQEFTNGDSFGIGCIGNQISAYYKSGAGAWVLLETRTDATYSAGGFLGAEISQVTGRIDDFGGGTTISGNPPYNFVGFGRGMRKT